jgi:4-amino-4-deoxy-L-arabinose transferase-like glycosyltransferase
MQLTDLNRARQFDRLYIQHPRRWVIGLAFIYLLIAGNYAITTPAWQSPDEPAHYNYVAYIATHFALPVLSMGDYDQALLATLLNSRFPESAPVELLRYEAYQPPLYYLVATPIFWLSGGSLLALRLWGVLIGMGNIWFLYACLELVFPGKPLINVTGAAFAALLPMHVAMSAAVNNDGLAELLVLVSMWMLMRWMQERFYPGRSHNFHERRHLLGLGLLLGLGMLTKVYAYALLPLCLITILVVAWRKNRLAVKDVVGLAARGVLPGLLLAAPWWLRNWLVYGAWDFLGTRWHDQVVAGQPRTSDWIIQYGLESYLDRAFTFTFRSFFGVFGWLGVFLDERIYTAFLLFTGVLFLGALWALVRLISGGPDMDMDDFQLWVLALFAAMIVVVLAAYGWYNLKFVQHQGRYLFWGLLPMGAFVGLGWREVLRPLQGVITGILTGMLATAYLVVGYVTGSFQEWTVLMVGLLSLFLLMQPLLLLGTQSYHNRWMLAVAQMSRRRVIASSLGVLRAFAWSSPFVLLIGVNLVIPALYIVPQLMG